MTERYHLSLKSANPKTGPIPVSTTTAGTCPDACPLRGAGCYAEQWPLAWFWRKLGTAKLKGLTLRQFCRRVAALPTGQLWRHNQAGDLPGKGDAIDVGALAAIARANEGRKGFTYTHKPMGRGWARNRAAVRAANAKGFVVNLSADSLTEADGLAALGVGPVVTLLPLGQTGPVRTPEGRLVVVCPAYTHGVDCQRCKLCAWGQRQVVVGFPAHGARAKTVTRIVEAGGQV
jgi:hypothetical protein